MLFLSRAELIRLNRRAKRRGVYYKVLSRLDRAVLDLVLKCVEKPRSPKLIDALAKIVVKIENALISPVVKFMNHVGRPLAEKLGRIAQGWGNKAASKWGEDRRFIEYLAVVEMNNISGFRLGDTR